MAKKNQEVKVENQVEESQDMEMELELDGDEVMQEMEEVVAENVKKEEQQNKEQKHKRGPKPKTEEEKAAKAAEKKETKKKELNLSDQNTIQREIKKGRISAPQGRIEKDENSSEYILKLADGVIFSKDAKDTMKEFDKIKVMNNGKYIVTNEAAKRLGTDKFKAQHENGQEVEHNYVRVELHKPGRDKDVVMLFTVAEAKKEMRELDAKDKRKEEEKKKKAEKEAKKKEEEKKAKELEKAEKEKEEKAG